MYKVLSGKEPAETLRAHIQEKIDTLNLTPRLAIVIVGDYKPSQIYVKRKQKTAASLGIETELHSLPQSVEESELLALVNRLNNDKDVHGFIVQAPLPKHIHTERVFEHISPTKDADGFHPSNMGKVLLNLQDPAAFTPATPTGIMYLLDYYRAPLRGQRAVVVGRSNIVGKPIALMLLHAHSTVTICHSKTKDLAAHTREGDILVVAAGSPGLIKADMVKDGAYVIDVGTTRVQVEGKDKVVGDVDFDSVIKKAHCSPVPGGVGPLTVAMLLSNVVKAAEAHTKK